jgi:hypothetical protein
LSLDADLAFIDGLDYSPSLCVLLQHHGNFCMDGVAWERGVFWLWHDTPFDRLLETIEKDQ